jgi:hypothetical protein
MSICASCLPGTYSTSIEASSINQCINCPFGKYSNTFAATTIDTCDLCYRGTYSSEGSSVCSQCDNGKYSLEQSNNCISCPHGFTSDNISTMCILESSHSYSNNEDFTSSLFYDVDVIGYEIFFNSLTFTEDGWDYLTIFDNNTAELYKNSGSSWPTVYLSSDAGIYINFNSDDSNHYYGYYMSIKPWKINPWDTSAPTLFPTKYPSTSPTLFPTPIPTSPTVSPTTSPTMTPTEIPTETPTSNPSTVLLIDMKFTSSITFSSNTLYI